MLCGIIMNISACMCVCARVRAPSFASNDIRDLSPISCPLKHNNIFLSHLQCRMTN